MKNTQRIWVLGSTVVIAGLLAGGWFIGAQPLLAAADSADQSAAQLAATNQAARIRLTGLQKEAADLGPLQAKQAAAVTAVPATLDANAFVQRINEVAGDEHVSVEAVTPGSPQAYAPPASVAAAAAAATPPAPGASPSPSPSPSAAPAAPTAPVLAASDPAITGANLTVVPMTVTVKGTMENTLRFTHDLQHDQRLFLVSSYTLAAQGQSTSKVSATLNGYIYTLKQ